VLGYYLELLREVPGTLVEAGSRWLTIIGLLAALLVAVGAIRDDSISPWLILVPVALLVVWGMAQANWERYARASEKATRTDQAEELARLLREQLQDCEKRYQVSQAQYEVFKQWDQEQGRGGAE
jgi:hypothetical protein